MLVDLKNIGIAVEIVLLSRIDELHVTSYALTVLGRHIWLLTYPDKRQYLDLSSRIAWHRKHRRSR